MTRPRSTLMLLIATVLALAVASVAVGQAASSERRLYRWTDASGKVHYTDALPPEVVDKARQELSAQTGLVREAVGRALTAEERLEAAARAEAEAVRRTWIENTRRADEARVSSFRSENELRAAYAERASILNATLASLQAAIDAQRESLMQQLALAGDAELAARAVPERNAAIIDELRREIINQEQAVLLRAAEQQALQEELERLVVLFHQREAKGLVPAAP
ncbi:DUF4124 domain-containing protein [Silanimonas sp.]|uniref:DUF4124 domain-containing protein n=1 Tax=Silanimonas sp. TaxID=1929290 RepID=UPI001BC497B5|nr:DUF4124 domain-containing protein [Silanimonas sp.]MBS3896860.1 DUF4124 domain-containing protein [Silanimonas sp.]MBS3924230.1 DUF4124 domain-containing protein [Xanthomonadaceae bacterium]